MGAPTGNQNASKSRVVHDALRKISLQEDHKRLRDGIEIVLDKASEGDMFAIQFVRDTLDGKPKQQVELSGDAENPVTIQEIKRTIVDARNPDS